MINVDPNLNYQVQFLRTLYSTFLFCCLLTNESVHVVLKCHFKCTSSFNMFIPSIKKNVQSMSDKRNVWKFVHPLLQLLKVFNDQDKISLFFLLLTSMQNIISLKSIGNIYCIVHTWHFFLWKILSIFLIWFFDLHQDLVHINLVFRIYGTCSS